MSRSSKPFVGLFTRGSLGHNQYSTGLLPLPLSASPHHLRIQQPNKARLCQYFFKGPQAANLAEATDKRAFVPHNLSLFTTSLRVRAMIFRVWTKSQRTSEQAFGNKLLEGLVAEKFENLELKKM